MLGLSIIEKHRRIFKEFLILVFMEGEVLSGITVNGRPYYQRDSRSSLDLEALRATGVKNYVISHIIDIYDSTNSDEIREKIEGLCETARRKGLPRGVIEKLETLCQNTDRLEAEFNRTAKEGRRSGGVCY